MNQIYLSLGSNLGDRKHHLGKAVRLIADRIGKVESISGYYKSEPWGYSSENSFLNCCLSLNTSLSPFVVLDQVLEIEKEMGREREGTGYSDRTIDIDLLLFGEYQLEHERLTLPHPSMGDRRFVLAPLAQIAPGLIHPLTRITISDMLERCPDRSQVMRMS